MNELNHLQDISQEEWEQIENYVLDNMTPEERAAFDAELANDPALQLKVENMRLLLVGLKEGILHNKLDTFHQQVPKAAKEIKMNRRPSSVKTWLIAASILLLAGVGGWLLLAKGNSNERLFAAYFKPDPGLITAMSATDNYAFERAMIDYKKGDYAAAIQTWDSLQKTQPANDTLNYFLGAAHLANENSKAAVSYLQKATTSAFFKDDAYWYLGLALLKEGKKAEAKKAISQSTHAQKDELLQGLK